jgi:hypothetical protein
LKTISLKIIKSIPGYSAGAVASVQVDSAGIPLNRFWRDRLKDAKIDGCVERVVNKKPKKQEIIQ